ncbi:MAG: hypothetical protein LBL62_00665, partial [Planctomycetaceae bacterium]|nr:hypothetical protein [Planctomycetaceae bacterium]
KNNKVNPYSVVLRNALSDVRVKNEVYHYYDNEKTIEFDELETIFKKLKKFFEQKNYREVVLICKACIEEFAGWLRKKKKNFDEIIDFINPEYYKLPFQILGNIVENSGVDLKELYDYCCVEIRKNKYDTPVIFTEFNVLFMHLSLKVNPDGFIEFQDELLNEVDDKNSYEARIILERKIDLYNHNNQPKNAWKIIESNIQFDSFFKKLAEKKIKEKKFDEAKKLINDYLKNKDKNTVYRSDWKNFLLKIAQKENDVQTVREISFAFIDNKFDAEYYKIYKSTFTDKEWKPAMEQLFTRYEEKIKSHGNTVENDGNIKANTYQVYASGDNSAFDLLVTENEIERLLKLVEKYPSVKLVEQYHEYFVATFPQHTLLLFRKVLDEYAKNNTGYDAFDYLAELLKKMQKIEGGEEIVSEMLKQYKILHKNKRSLREMISKF